MQFLCPIWSRHQFYPMIMSSCELFAYGGKPLWSTSSEIVIFGLAKNFILLFSIRSYRKIQMNFLDIPMTELFQKWLQECFPSQLLFYSRTWPYCHQDLLILFSLNLSRPVIAFLNRYETVLRSY